MHRGRERISTPTHQWINPESDDKYQRPSDWITLTSVSVGEQKIVGSYAVYDSGSNFCAVLCQGAYTINWGDGSAEENVATSTQAQHNYVYSDLDAGTYCTRGYRQAIVTITPQAGQNLTYVSFDRRHTSENQIYSTQWLEMVVVGTNFTNIYFGVTSLVTHGMLETFSFIGPWSISTALNMFFDCRALQNVKIPSTAGVTVFQSMFYNCANLRTAPNIDTSSGTNFVQMFYGCTALKNVPLLDLSNALSCRSMFNICAGLQKIPPFNTSSCSNFSRMFYICYALPSIPLLDTSSGTDFSEMFYACYSLKTIPLLDTSSGVDFYGMFYLCQSLQYLPSTLDTSNGTRLLNMFNTAISLQAIPALNIANATNVTSIFSTTRSLLIGAFASQSIKVSISYANCRLSRTDCVNVIESLYDFPETLTVDVSPVTDWVADDIITGQTSGKTCVVVAKLSATTYTVKTRSGAFTLGEIIGVTGVANKLADQGASYPTFSGTEILTIDVAPATAWAVGDTITGQTSAKTCTVVSQLNTYGYLVSARSGTYTSGEIMGVTGTPAKLADQGVGYPLFAGRGNATLTLTGNWGAASLSAAEQLVATNRGWTLAL